MFNKIKRINKKIEYLEETIKGLHKKINILEHPEKYHFCSERTVPVCEISHDYTELEVGRYWTYNGKYVEYCPLCGAKLDV